MSITRIQPYGGLLSHALVHQGTVYITGQVADDYSLDVRGQTEQVLARIDRLLDEAGSDRSHILFAQVWLKHAVDDFEAMNDVWRAWIPQDALPARATVEANLADADIRVEIAVQAAVKR
ncbi:RidA family protein [Pseudomonas mangiferae]|uniref:RidA family protein n=1 Tax=Pseudomonas mangiferae TaxID=2593654 RepID=A0A553H2U5_9PSED|nr:RidA family protein [Pseudomonas mangiferae]TRX76072.1 RidA family protein [Pseudomonas mangiferae]